MFCVFTKCKILKEISSKAKLEVVFSKTFIFFSIYIFSYFHFFDLLSESRVGKFEEITIEGKMTDFKLVFVLCLTCFTITTIRRTTIR